MSFLSKLECLIPPPVVLLLLGALAWAIAVVLPGAAVLPSASLSAIVVGLAGLVLNLGPKVMFRRAGTTVNPLRPGSSMVLVRSGLYRFSRNPMYFGHVLLLLAWVIWLRNAAAFPLVFVHLAYLTRFQVIPEERALAARFPDAYADFVRGTRRWL